MDTVCINRLRTNRKLLLHQQFAVLNYEISAKRECGDDGYAMEILPHPLVVTGSIDLGILRSNILIINIACFVLIEVMCFNVWIKSIYHQSNTKVPIRLLLENLNF